MSIQLTPRRFTAAEYRQMIQAGVFGEDERLELIDGEVVEISPIGDRHAACVRRLIALLSRLFAADAIVDAQDPRAAARSLMDAMKQAWPTRPLLREALASSS